MVKFSTVLLTLLTLSTTTFGQIEPITVSEQTIKVNGENEFYFGFAEGDEIIFDLQVVKGKNVKEVEILEYPSSSKFFEFKATKISDKRIKVNKTAIYKFRLKGGGLGTKICQAKILRVPGSAETANFNTSVKWNVRRDSTYETRYRKVLVKSDTTVDIFMDRVERVHSQTNLDNPNRSSFVVELPANKRSELQTSEVISWAYWFGVGDEGLAQYEKEKKKYLLDQVSTVSALANPVAGLALGTYVMLSNPPEGDNVHYWLSATLNGEPISLGNGNSVVAHKRITNITQGSFRVTLENDNTLNGINVNIKFAAAIVNKTYENQAYQELLVQEHNYPSLQP